MADRAIGRMVPVAVLVIAISSVAWLPAWTGEPRVADPHGHFQNPESCPHCHLRVDGKPEPGRFVAEADRFCLDCHRGEELGRSHPRNVRPRDNYRMVKIPEEYRLDDDGRILCLTCHRGHGTFLSTVQAFPGQKPEGDSPAGKALYRTFYLRKPDPRKGFSVLCTGCHPRL